MSQDLRKKKKEFGLCVIDSTVPQPALVGVRQTVEMTKKIRRLWQDAR